MKIKSSKRKEKETKKGKMFQILFFCGKHMTGDRGNIPKNNKKKKIDDISNPSLHSLVAEEQQEIDKLSFPQVDSMRNMVGYQVGCQCQCTHSCSLSLEIYLSLSCYLVLACQKKKCVIIPVAQS